MHGGKDSTVPARDLYELAALLQGAHPTVIELANENHFYGNLEEAAADIRGFLRTLPKETSLDGPAQTTNLKSKPAR
jgi:hypothetical protein